MMGIARINHEDLDLLRSLLESGMVRPVIDRLCRPAETTEAVRYLEGGHAKGKVVLQVDHLAAV